MGPQAQVRWASPQSIWPKMEANNPQHGSGYDGRVPIRPTDDRSNRSKPLKFIHSSDWQIGKSYGFADDATREILRSERLEAIARLGQLAQQHGASTVLVAGDVYDMAAPSDRTLRQPIERMRQSPGVIWHLIPGNHDFHGPSGPWDRLARMGLPGNVRLHLIPEPADLGGGTAFVVPAVLTRRHASGDPTETMDRAATPEGAIRIGLAHGSVTNFGSDLGSTHNLIAFDRPDRAGLAYLALGDWHGAQLIGQRAAYSGTPEPDGFDLGGRGGGEALLVEVDGPRALPRISFLSTGRYVWRRESATLAGDADLPVLESRLRGLHSDPGHLLVRLDVNGVLSAQGLQAFERNIRGGVGSALCALRIDDFGLRLQPSASDLAALSRAGVVGVVASRLAARADDPTDPQRDLAQAALQRLYILHSSQERAV